VVRRPGHAHDGRPDQPLLVVVPRPVVDPAQRADGHLGRQDHRLERRARDRAHVGQRESATGHVGRCQLAVCGLCAELGQSVRHADHAERLHVFDVGHGQSQWRVDGHANVVRPVGPVRREIRAGGAVDARVPGQRQRRGLHQERQQRQLDVRRQLRLQFDQPGQVHLVRDHQRRYLVGRLHRLPHGLGVARQRHKVLGQRSANRRGGRGGCGRRQQMVFEP